MDHKVTPHAYTWVSPMARTHQ